MAKRLSTDDGKSLIQRRQEHNIALICKIYTIYMMFAYVIFCSQGYVAFDTNKRIIFMIGLAALVVAFLLCKSSSLDDKRRQPLKSRIGILDYGFMAIGVSWIIATLLSSNKSDAIWGDTFRVMGLVFMLGTVVAAWIFSRYGKWDDTLTWCFLVMVWIENFMEIMQYLGHDFLNWQMDGQYTYLKGTLGAKNQNGCFIVITLAILMAMFLLCRKQSQKIAIGVALFTDFAAGVVIESAVFYVGMAAVIIVFVYCVLARPEHLKCAWIESVIFYAALVAMALTYKANPDGVLLIEETSYTLFEVRSLIIIAAGIALIGAIVFAANNLLAEIGNAIARVYGCIILAVTFITALLALIANASGATSGFLAKFVISDDFGTRRGMIWKAVLGAFSDSSIINQIFGHGFGQLSQLQLLAEEFASEGTIADAHNTFFDMLYSTGVIGALLYMAIIIALLVWAVRLYHKDERNMIGILAAVSFITVGLINSNLNVTTPLAWIAFGFAFKFILDGKEAVSTEK